MGAPQKDYIDWFAKYITDKASERLGGEYSKIDPVTVISTNWDILLDKSIYRCIKKFYNDQAVVDYCCHISSYYQDDNTVKPGLEMLGKGGFNVKLLKLHGSLNWLQCPKCARLYVAFDSKIGNKQDREQTTCRHCDTCFSDHKNSHKLKSNLIMPTFLKDLSNPQYKLIWQNAGIELSEATKIVFIGYSLPLADFEMRQLLARMLRVDAEIEVVDFGSKRKLKIKEMMSRYKVFFGIRKPKFYLQGARDYIEHMDGAHFTT